MEEKKKIYTLCYIFDGQQVLLGKKLRGWGVGWWNGFGGKPEAGESIEAAAVREMEQESGVQVKDLEKRAVIQFRFELSPGEVNEVHVFKAERESGEPVITDEMEPRWFLLTNLPWEEMWSSDRVWLEKFFAGGSKFRGRFLFEGSRETNGEAKVVKEYELEEVESLD